MGPLLPCRASLVLSNSRDTVPLRDPGPTAPIGPDLLDCPPPLLVRLDQRSFVVKPETVVGRHGARFRPYWRWRPRPGRGRLRSTNGFASCSGAWLTKIRGLGIPKI